MFNINLLFDVNDTLFHCDFKPHMLPILLYVSQFTHVIKCDVLFTVGL